MLQITPRERLALQLLAEGKDRTELAASLELADGELDACLIALFERMGVQTPPQAVAAAVKRGLVDPIVRRVAVYST
ncbi:MAG TPA: LuxR C-terminal-related transcriptional regulator [Vicinamibacterales bacterium]|nr:LuxR C-terminal-related transcriptional regulator [Vicinamibacterales bacterium]